MSKTVIRLMKFGRMSQGKYPTVKKCATRLSSIFGTTYSCEALYSTLKFIKSKRRSVLTEHLT